MQGVVELFQRYNAFVTQVNKVKKAFEDYIQNPSKYNKRELTAEFERSTKMKEESEAIIYEEIKRFAEKYENEYPRILEEYYVVSKEINREELEVLRGYSLYFGEK
jgi:hypothetical protein